MAQFNDIKTAAALPQEPEKKFTLREVFFKYLSHLPLFLMSIALCVGSAMLYLRYTVPLYRAQANMLIRTSDDNNVTSSSASSSGNNDLVTNAVFGGRRVNLDNEIERLRSNSFLSRVVIRTGTNITYYDRGNIKKSDVYKDCPFKVTPITMPDSASSFNWYFSNLNINGGYISQSIKENDNKNGIKFKWGDSISIGNALLHIEKQSILDSAVSAKKYLVTWLPVNAAANKLRGSLLITPLNAKATIIQLAIKNENGEEGKEVLNALIIEYSKMNVEDKNKVAQNTIRFINERLNVVTSELGNITAQIQDYKDSNQILDIPKQFGFYLDNSLGNLKIIEGIDVNLGILSFLEDYLKSPSKKDSLIISPLGLTDAAINQLIANYNQILLQRNREIIQIQPSKNLNLESWNNQLADIHSKLFESIANLRKLYLQQKQDYTNKNAQYQVHLSTLPHQDIHVNELVRQQNIKQQLYLYLLNKREETEISSASTVSDYQQLEFAEASGKPVEPQEGNIRLFSIILGFLLPIGIIYVLDLLNDKLITRDDITNRTNLPITGEISHLDKTLSNIVVGQSRNMIAEQFRILRSNLQFLLKEQDGCKVFLVTSSISGEGKSFISLNLASVISLSGKKVALLEFDLRKMRGNVYTGEKQNSKGITNYLIGQTDNPLDIITTVEKFPDLHIFRSGPIPPNPAELVMGDKVNVFMTWLQEKYDYIVIDSAPVGLVSDSFALVKYSQAVLYVVRQRYTFKKQIEFVNDISQQNKLQNVALVVNDVHMGGKYGYYGYGYGYGYGYVYRYGFGYRYGYGYGAYAGKYFKKGAEGYFDLPSKKKS